MLAVCVHAPVRSHPCALLSDSGRALFIGDLRFAAKLCLFLRIKSRSRTDGASLDGAEGAVRRKEPEKEGVWRKGFAKRNRIKYGASSIFVRHKYCAAILETVSPQVKP